MSKSNKIFIACGSAAFLLLSTHCFSFQNFVVKNMNRILTEKALSPVLADSASRRRNRTFRSNMPHKSNMKHATCFQTAKEDSSPSNVSVSNFEVNHNFYDQSDSGIQKATNILQSFDRAQAAFAKEENIGMGGGVSASMYAFTLSDEEIAEIKASVILLANAANNQRASDQRNGRVMLGICAEDCIEALTTLKVRLKLGRLNFFHDILHFFHFGSSLGSQVYSYLGDYSMEWI